MSAHDTPTCTAFDGQRLLASGSLASVALEAKRVIDAGAPGPVLVFEDHTGRAVDIDYRGTPEQMLARLVAAPADQPAATRGPGRPKLGVVPREVTLLPRHWDWLAAQPGGASATLRRLVEEARRSHHGRDRLRQAGEALDRFMLAMTGDLPGYEEASRAFWRQDRDRFDALTSAWPDDLREHVRRLADQAWHGHASH
ncbi:DUF2239 family protein [Dyella solisilvae]|uniref:DUF2239 family protein n=1 Tax=Dyella solisilvae TaxID=1920168 RepID=A0A370K8S3_9GAMM|nr:DUF2239 family protein [Dyella solisilvae]RDI99045.1 DUF2239 family protein [Dyella solisilvae]